LNWLGLAEVSTTLASVERPQGHQDLWWAHVALAAYQVILDATGQSDSIEVSMMHLRALFIS